MAEQSIVSETYDSIRAGIIELLRAARLFHQTQLVPQPLFPARPNHPDRSEPEKQGRGNVVAHHDDKNARKVLGTRSQVGSSISGPLLRQLPTAGLAGFITILSAS